MTRPVAFYDLATGEITRLGVMSERFARANLRPGEGVVFTGVRLDPVTNVIDPASGAVVERANDATNPRATEAQTRRIRAAVRGHLLASDFTQGADVPFTEAERAAWAVYRAALRALSDHPDFPWVELPTPPSN